jgi:hypothetical protein
LLVHYIEQSTFFLSSAVLPHPTQYIGVLQGTPLKRAM